MKHLKGRQISTEKRVVMFFCVTVIFCKITKNRILTATELRSEKFQNSGGNKFCGMDIHKSD